MSLEVITGPMFAGKTSELIRLVERAVYAKKRVAIFKPALDKRYSESEVVTHNGLRYQAYVIPTNEEGIQTIRQISNDLDVIGIDEAQFFPRIIVKLCDELVSKGKRVIVSGLNLDFRGEPFEVMADFLVRADPIYYLTAVCTICGKEATRTQRLIDGNPAPYNSPRIMVGGKELYEARCRIHHIVPGKPE